MPAEVHQYEAVMRVSLGETTTERSPIASRAQNAMEQKHCAFRISMVRSDQVVRESCHQSGTFHSRRRTRVVNQRGTP